MERGCWPIPSVVLQAERAVFPKWPLSVHLQYWPGVKRGEFQHPAGVSLASPTAPIGSEAPSACNCTAWRFRYSCGEVEAGKGCGQPWRCCTESSVEQDIHYWAAVLALLCARCCLELLCGCFVYFVYLWLCKHFFFLWLLKHCQLVQHDDVMKGTMSTECRRALLSQRVRVGHVDAGIDLSITQTPKASSQPGLVLEAPADMSFSPLFALLNVQMFWVQAGISNGENAWMYFGNMFYVWCIYERWKFFLI